MTVFVVLKIRVTGYQSALLCQSCYTHLDDFHKFALLIKERQESLTNVNIPIIKLESSDEEEENKQSYNGYIRDSDVVVEFQADGDDQRNGSKTTMQFGDDELLIPSTDFQNNSNYSAFEQMSWLSGEDSR